MAMKCIVCEEDAHGRIHWCGGLCVNDPQKRNPMLFHPDGRLKTLKERGLGFDDPPDVAHRLLKGKPLRRGKGNIAGMFERAKEALRVVRDPAPPARAKRETKPPETKPRETKSPETKPGGRPKGKQPWLALGISRAAWYRRQREND